MSDNWLWLPAIAVAVLLILCIWSLLRSPLEPVRRLIWVLVILALPVAGCLAWLWWRFSYYPKRTAEQPDWDPNNPLT